MTYPAPRFTPAAPVPAAPAATPEQPATVAYTRFVLDQGAAGDLLDLHVALAPCVIGYAEIGRALAAGGADAPRHHPYREWIAEYASMRASPTRLSPWRLGATWTPLPLVP